MNWKNITFAIIPKNLVFVCRNQLHVDHQRRLISCKRSIGRSEWFPTQDRENARPQKSPSLLFGYYWLEIRWLAAPPTAVEICDVSNLSFSPSCSKEMYIRDKVQKKEAYFFAPGRQVEGLSVPRGENFFWEGVVCMIFF